MRTGSPKKTTMTTVTRHISDHYVQKGLTEKIVTSEHFQVMSAELSREREVSKSLQKDNGMLRAQLERRDNNIRSLEKVRIE